MWDDFLARVQSRQRELGMSGTAVKSGMLDELQDAEKRRREAEQSRKDAEERRAKYNSPEEVAERERREQNAYLSQSASRGRDAIYGVDTQVQRMLMQGAAMGLNPQAVENKIAEDLHQALKNAGMGELEAGAASDRIVEENKQRLAEQGQRAIGGLMDTMAQRQRDLWRGPELIRAADFTAKAQTSTDMAKQIDLARSQDAHLVEVVTVLNQIASTPARTRLS